MLFRSYPHVVVYYLVINTSSMCEEVIVRLHIGQCVLPFVSACALNDNDNMIEVNAVIKMEVGPPQVSYRRDLQNAPRCFLSDWEVLNGMGKKSCWKD